MTTTKSPQSSILSYPIQGARRPSNIFYAAVVAIGASGFLLAGLSSYLHVNLLPFNEPLQLEFLPQGLALLFYGTAGFLLDVYLLTSMILDFGGGFNEFNQETGKIRIFRWGFPGKNRKIDLEYAIADVQAIRVEIREGLNPKRALYLRLRGKGEIPLTEVGQPLALSALEDRAAELARFLSVPLEGL